jgi:hypothetical protein
LHSSRLIKELGKIHESIVLSLAFMFTRKQNQSSRTSRTGFHQSWGERCAEAMISNGIPAKQHGRSLGAPQGLSPEHVGQRLVCRYGGASGGGRQRVDGNLLAWTPNQKRDELHRVTGSLVTFGRTF